MIRRLLKSVLTAVEAVYNAISDKEGPYLKLQYLESKAATRLKTRYAQQEALLRALIDSKLIHLFNAALAGQLLIMNDPDDKPGTSIMATTQNPLNSESGVTVTSLSGGLTFHPLGPQWDTGSGRRVRWLTE